MLNNNSLTRLSFVNPKLGDKIKTLAAMLEQENIIIQVTQGFRTWIQQHVLYVQGREDLATVNAARKLVGLAAITDAENIKVTNADSGYSWHNYGLAVDVAPFVDGVPHWDDNDPSWDRIVAVGESLGLRSGKSWHDEPHLEYTGRYGPTPDADVRNLFLAANDHGSGTQAIWDSAQIV